METAEPEAGSAPEAEPRAPSVWRNRDFTLFLGGQAVSALGDAVSFTALPLLVLQLTGSGVQMGLVAILQTLPDLVLGLPAGALADRYDRRRMMFYADLGRAGLTGLIPLSFMLGWDTMAVILLVTAPINLLRVIFMAGFTSAVPKLVGREQTGAATGYVEAMFSFSFILGPAVAGILIGVIGAPQTLALDAISFAVSSAALFLIRRPLQGERGATETHLLREMADGVRFIWREKVLRAVIGLWSAVSVVGAPIVAAFIFYLTVDRQQPSEVVGLVISGYGVGSLIGALLAGRRAKGALGRTMLMGNVAMYLVLVPFALGEWVPIWIGTSFLVGLSGAFVAVSYFTLRATIPPDELLGRVGSTARTLSLGLQPIGLAIGGILLDAIGGRLTMLTISAAAIGVTLLFALSPTVRNARMPEKSAGQ